MTKPLRPGSRAPALTLPAVNGQGNVSLADFRGRRAVMIGLFRGLHCPFCRRQIAQLGVVQPRLAALGVETIAVVNTPLERAKLYFRYRPSALLLLSDPDCESHRMFGLPRLEFAAPGEPAQWPRISPEQWAAARVDPTGELGGPTQPMEANGVLNRKDGFQETPEDDAIFAAHGGQLAGQFLIDVEGVVRWSWAEAPSSPNEIASFPPSEDLVAAARSLGNPDR